MRTTATNIFLSALALGSGLVEGARLPRRADSPTVVTTTVTEAAAPTGPSASDWASGATRDVPIHNSCNATQRALLSRGFDDAMRLAGHARDHVLRFGNSSDFYTKYFGSAATAEVVGWYDRIVYGDKGGMWFRCDDIDGNCQQDGESYLRLGSVKSVGRGKLVYGILTSLVTYRLGGSLARRERNPRDGDLPAILHDAATVRGDVRVRIPGGDGQASVLLRV